MTSGTAARARTRRSTVPAAACDPVRRRRLCDRPRRGRRRDVPAARWARSWRAPTSRARSGWNSPATTGRCFPHPTRYGTLMQENMGNGAAVGDYDGDGYLDVLLLGQAGHQTKLFHNDPAPGGGRRFTDVTDAAGLGGVTSNARVAQFVDLSGSGRPDLVIAADYMPGGPGGPSQILRNNGDGTFTDVTAGSGFDPDGLHRGRHDLRRLRRHRPPEHLPQLLDRGARRRPCPGRRSRARSRGRTGCTGTSVTTASRTSPTRAGSANITPTASRPSSPTSPVTIDRTSSRPTTIGPTGSTRTSAADGSRTRAMPRV